MHGCFTLRDEQCLMVFENKKNIWTEERLVPWMICMATQCRIMWTLLSKYNWGGYVVGTCEIVGNYN